MRTTLLPTSRRPLDPSSELARLLQRRAERRARPGGGEAGERELETALMVHFRDHGSAAAFEALYERTRGAMLSWILHLAAGRELDPLDLLQDTYVNVYRYARSFRTDGNRTFRAWARTIAANVVRRARTRRGLLLESLPIGAREPVDARGGPEGLASLREQRLDLRRAWTLLLLHWAVAYEKLSERDRLALHLVEVEELSYDEAGERLGVGRSNMKMIMFRSRKRLRAHIARAMEGAAEPADRQRAAS